MMLVMASSAEKHRVGALIRDRRQELGLKQPEFAALVGVSRNTVSSWEQGHKYPARHLGRIKAVLGISLTDTVVPDPVVVALRAVPDLDPDVAEKLVELYLKLAAVEPSANGSSHTRTTTG